MCQTDFWALGTFLSFTECILSVLLFALSVGLMAGMNNITKVIASKLDRRREDDARFSELENEISEARQRMSALSPTADFAQYFKLERRVNNLTDKCKIIISSRKTNQPNSRKLAIALRLTALFVSLALAFHSSAGTKLFTMDANYLYPFNFLLDFPFSVADFRWSGGVKRRQSVGLFSLSILSIFVLRIWQNARKEASKKLL